MRKYVDDFFKSYDKYIFAFSGGKDSIACVLNAIEIGIPIEKMELWHHDIDGRGEVFMDWECTPAYCKAFADAMCIPFYSSWKEGGFKREMLRVDALTAPTCFEIPGGEVVTIGGERGKLNTRLKFPQVSPDLSVRWCSAYLKIDIGATAIRNQDRFKGIRTLFISGERAEESAARAKYADIEADRADLRDGKQFTREVDRWRPIKGWTEQMVWAIIERWKVRVHPAYYMGWGRLSCKTCIFGNANQFASANKVSPKQVNEISMHEDSFGYTIKRNMSIRDLLKLGTPYAAITDELTAIATSFEYTLPIFFGENEAWLQPAGAYGDSCGPL